MTDLQSFKINFKELPFKPDGKQVIFVENGYDEVINDIIKENYHLLKKELSYLRYEFIYLPLLSEDDNFIKQVRYYAPYLGKSATIGFGMKSSTLLNYMVRQENRAKIGPALLFNAQEEGDEWCFDGLFLKPSDFVGDHIERAILTLINRPIHHLEEDELESSIRFRIAEDNCAKMIDKDLFDIHPSCCMESEEEFFKREDLESVLKDLEDTVRELRLKGVTLLAIHELIDKQEPLSKMVITSDYRIFLPDYDNMEIKMGTLPKALFFLFLRYTKGIAFSYLPDHKKELLNIYRQLRPNTSIKRMEETISKVVDPLGNSINENVARIRAAFIKKFDDHLAKNYYIRGKAGLEYGITLNRDLVVWEE